MQLIVEIAMKHFGGNQMNLMNQIKGILTLTFALSALVSCSNDNRALRNLTSDDAIALRSELAASNAIMITDENGQAISGAEILIGHSVNSPFPNNIVVSDSKGIISIPTAWTQELPVTILKDGYIKTSYLKQKPEGQIFEVRRKQTPNVRQEVKGSISGFGNLPNDGFIDFGLAISSLDNTSALNFDITQLISEEYDTISVMGQQLDIPTNIFVPKQKESYGFIPLTVEKAFYRLFFGFTGTYKVQANLGKFDFKKVADKLKAGKSYFEVVNDFTFSAIGTKAVNVNQQNVSLDIIANQKKLAPKVSFSMPAPQKGMLFGVTMYEEEGRLHPTDIKLREGTAPQTLLLPETSSRGSVLFVHADKVQVTKDIAALSPSMSTALVDSQQVSQGFILDRIEAPTVTPNGMKLSKPNLKGSLKGFATYAALSDIQRDEFKRFSLDRADVVWEVYSPGWVDEINLPEVSSVRAGQRWQVVFYGVDSAQNKKFNGPKTLNQATHAVHNAVNF